jgi:hypothetical protein
VTTLKLAVPFRVESIIGGDEWAKRVALSRPVAQQHVDVKIQDYRPIVMGLRALQDRYALENMMLVGVLLGAVTYLSLRKYVTASEHLSERHAGDHLEMLGMRIYMDPSRDEGPMVPLFAEREAINLYALRRARIDK